MSKKKKSGGDDASKDAKNTRGSGEPDITNGAEDSNTEKKGTEANSLSSSNSQALIEKGADKGDSGKSGGPKKDAKNQKPNSNNSANASNPIAGFAKFLKEVRIEIKKISWPERNQVFKETWSVVVLVALITFLVLGYDYVLGHFVFGPIEHWAKIHNG